MIVADANVLAYLLVPQRLSRKAEHARAQGKLWAVPAVLPHELLRALLRYVRHGDITLDEADRFFRCGLSMVEISVIPIDGNAVLRLAERSGCSSYDSEYVWLAMELGVQLLTEDKEVLSAFPDVAVNLDYFT